MRGALLTFGGPRGANVALMVEVLAAGVAGALWSLDAPSFSGGTRSPGAGLLVIAITATLLEADFAARLDAQLARLESEGVHVPGRARAGGPTIEVADELAEQIDRRASRPRQPDRGR